MSFASFMDNLKKHADTLTNEIKKFQNKNFMEATTAACAIVAAADGSIDSDEKQKMAGFIKMNDSLNIFDMNTVIKSFNKFVDGLEFDHGIGFDACMKAIEKIADDFEAGRLLVRVACAIGAADGDFDDQEKEVVRKICKTCNQNPNDFSL